MNKSEEFERDLDSDISERKDVLIFDEDSNEHFVHEDKEEFLLSGDLKQMLRDFFGSQKERLRILQNYSNGKNETILSGRRRLEKEKADYRISHNYGGYISTFITGFVLGMPLTIGSELKESDDVKDIDEIHFDNDIDTLNFDLGYDTSRFGRAFELHYRDSNNADKIVLISPLEMFVVRTADVTKEIIAAVHCPIYNGKIYLTVYTDNEVISYIPFKSGTIDIKEKSRKGHSYKMVPVVEWWNNRYRQGDFEKQIPSIDAYDSAQSDIANYMSDLNDAMLVIEGDVYSSGRDAADYKKMKDANFLLLESGISQDGKERKLSAGYIYKQYDVAGTEAYKDRLIADIFKLSNLPNLDDESFGTQSGIALQYKLLGLRQIQVTKVNYYTRALRRRYQLIENIHKEVNDVEIKANALTFTFHPNLPQDVWEEVEKFIESGGDLSQETLLELASFTSEEKEKERILNEEDR